MTTLRQLLEILDILVKNEDFDSTRTLTTYLFTKPNAIKRFEFLVESATDKNESLKQVIYYFRPPFDVSDYDGTNALDDYDEQLDNAEGASNDDDAHGGDEYAENHETIEDEDAAYEYDDDGYADNYEGDGGDEAAEHHDGGVDYSTADETPAANDNDDRADDFGGNGAEVAANEEEDLIDYADDEINDGQGHIEQSASAGTETVSNHKDEEELIDYSDDKIADDYASAFPRSSDRPESVANGEEDTIDYTDDKNSAADENDLIGYESSGEANESADQGEQKPSQAGHEDEGKGADHHDATSEHDINHVEDGVDPAYSNDYPYTAAGNNVVSYDADDGDLIDYSSDKFAAGNGNVASVEEGQVSVESVQEGVAQAEATQADATGNAANSTGQYQNSHLQVGARHSRNASDISITFSAAEADGVLPAHAQSANDHALGFSLDESAELDYADSEGTQTSAGRHPIEGGIATTGTTESSTSATLGNDDDIDMSLNPPAGEDELSEIDWREDPVPTVGSGVADAQSNAMKRAHPHEMDAQDGNGMLHLGSYVKFD